MTGTRCLSVASVRFLRKVNMKDCSHGQKFKACSSDLSWGEIKLVEGMYLEPGKIEVERGMCGLEHFPLYFVVGAFRSLNDSGAASPWNNFFDYLQSFCRCVVS